MLRFRPYFWPVLSLVLAGSLSAFPLWLDSPERLNRFDPKSPLYQPLVTNTPNYTATPTASPSATLSPTISPSFTDSPTATPSPTPTPSQTPVGLTVLLADTMGNPMPGGTVMLGSDTAGAQVTNAQGEVFFPGAVPPFDIHAFAADSFGFPLYSPTIVSYYNATVLDVTLRTFTSFTVAAAPLSWTVSSSAGGTHAEAYIMNNLGASSSNLCTSACWPNINNYANSRQGESWSASLLETNSGGSILAAFFQPPTLLPGGGLGFSGTTSAYSASNVAFSFSGYGGAQLVAYSTFAGPKASRYYLRQKANAFPAPAGPITYQVAVPGGAAPVVVRGDLIRYTTGTDVNISSVTRSQASLPATAALTYPGEADWTAHPDAGSAAFGASATSGGTADAWFAYMSDAGDATPVWFVLRGCAACSSVSGSLPTAFPAWIPAGYQFGSGDPVARYLEAYSGLAFDPADPMNYNADDATIRGHYFEQNW